MQEKKAAVNAAIEKYLACFEKVLYEDDKTFLVNMRKKNIPEEEIEKYRYRRSSRIPAGRTILSSHLIHSLKFLSFLFFIHFGRSLLEKLPIC